MYETTSLIFSGIGNGRESTCIVFQPWDHQPFEAESTGLILQTRRDGDDNGDDEDDNNNNHSI